METNVERTSGNLAQLTVTVPAEDVERAVAAAYKNVAEKLRVPGFRKGKAPRPIVDQRVGKSAVLAQAQEAIVQDSYPKALDAEDLRTVGQPDVGELEEPVEGEPYTYTAEVELRPEFELVSDEPITIEVPPKHATEREVEAQVEQMRERFATLEPVEDRGVTEDDFVLVSFVGKVDGQDYEGNKVDKYLYEMGRGLLPKEFDEALVGAKPGDEATAEFVVPDASSNPEFVGKTATFDVTIHEVKAKILPELDDEFASNVGGYDTMQELRDDIRRKIDEAKAYSHPQMVEREARRALAERVEGEIPEALVQQTHSAMMRDFLNSLESRGTTLKDYIASTGLSLEQIEREMGEQAERAVSEELALEALFRREGMEVTDEDLDASFREMAGDTDGAAEQLREKWEAAGVLGVVREQVVHRKAVRWLMDNVEIVEKEPADDGNDEGAGESAESIEGTAGPEGGSKAETEE